MFYGYVLLLAIAALVYFGVLHRVLDRMGLTDKVAILFIAAILIGGLIPDIPLADNLAINIGGGIIPILLVGYLFYLADKQEKIRAGLSALIAGIAVYLTARILPLEPTYAGYLDPTYTFGIIAGLIGYIAARSRRSAFIAGISGIILNDIFSRIDVFMRGARGTTIIGGAGVFDTVIIAGLIAVVLCEIVGESYERLTGGPQNKTKNQNSSELSYQEFSNELSEEADDDDRQKH